jgi:hypothetical protein
MTQIIALDATTGAWNARLVKNDLADNLLKAYIEVSEEMKSPWVFFKMATDATIVEIEAAINECLGEYVRFGGLAAAE